MQFLSLVSRLIKPKDHSMFICVWNERTLEYIRLTQYSSKWSEDELKHIERILSPCDVDMKRQLSSQEEEKKQTFKWFIRYSIWIYAVTIFTVIGEWWVADLGLSRSLFRSCIINNQFDLLPVCVSLWHTWYTCEQHFPSRKMYKWTLENRKVDSLFLLLLLLLLWVLSMQEFNPMLWHLHIFLLD